MFMPSIFNDNLFDDFMNFPFRDFDDTEKKLYGHNAARVMKTDVHENDGNYELDIDLPGFKKDQINLSLENGYLIVKAAKDEEESKKNKKGKVIRCERYSGSMSRSFYIGEQVTDADVKAKFENGVLKLTVPKKDAPKLPEKKTIMIEG